LWAGLFALVWVADFLLVDPVALCFRAVRVADRFSVDLPAALLSLGSTLLSVAEVTDFVPLAFAAPRPGLRFGGWERADPTGGESLCETPSAPISPGVRRAGRPVLVPPGQPASTLSWGTMVTPLKLAAPVPLRIPALLDVEALLLFTIHKMLRYNILADRPAWRTTGCGKVHGDRRLALLRNNTPATTFGPG